MLITQALAFRTRAEHIYFSNTKTLLGIRLLRPIWILTAICASGIGVVSVALACGGESTAPLLCLVISLPAFAWGARFALKKPISFDESIAYLAYCDIAMTVGVYIVAETGIALLKLVWLLAANAYAFAFHGRLAMGLQAVSMVLAAVLTVDGAAVRGDSCAPALVATVATVALVNTIAAWAIRLGIDQFAEFARVKDHLALHDELTGLLNRRGLRQACTDWCGDRINRHVIVAVIDLNGFKAINDNHGHHAGDQALRHTAQGLQALAGPETWLVRLGGDEFGVVAIVDAANVLNYQRNIENALSGVFFVDASMGVASEKLWQLDSGARLPLTAIVAELLMKADSAMYLVKRRAAAIRTCNNRCVARTIGIDDLMGPLSAARHSAIS